MKEYLPKPKRVQLEISSMCNALCLGCARTNKHFNSSKSSVPKKQIVSLETIEKLLTDPAMDEVHYVQFCGTIDEPLMHPQFLEIIDLLYKINPKYRISIHTNASVRTPEFFESLALKLQKFSSYKMNFSIDGIGETHSLYRQFTNYDKIIENAKAFIRANGKPVWQFLVFPWNIGQIEEAKKISQEIGFVEFHARRDRSQASRLGLEKINKLQTIKTDPIEDNTLLEDLIESYSNLSNIEIDCHYRKEQMVFVSYDSRLWPCCFVSNGFFHNKSKVNFLKARLYNNYGEEFNDLTIHTASDILNNDFYKNDLVESFSNPVDIGSCGKLTRCAETCNVQKLKSLPIAKHQRFKNETKQV